MRLHVLGVVVCCAASGCKSVKAGAADDFGKRYSCPESRITVKARSDLHWGDLFAPPPGEPSAEVKADPERLAKWTRDQVAARAESRSALSQVDVFEVRGCDHDELVGCWRAGEDDTVVCDVVPPEKRPK